jgi:DHA1 family bicyclomycin/chloramphenicol resistance-like MFS transporter
VPQTKKPPKGLTLIVAMTSMIGPFTIDTYLPSFPAIEAEFGISRALLSQSLAFYLAAFAISTLVLGPLADRLGRRRVVLGSLLVYVAASLGCALASDYGTFLFYRLMQGVAAGGGLVAGRAMIRDVYNPRDAQRAMSRVMMLFAVAPAIAPVIGGWLHDAFGWHSVFHFLALYSTLVFVVVVVWIPETLAPALRQSYHPVSVARVYGRTLVHRRFLSLVFVVSCYFGGMFLYIAGAPTVIFDFMKLESGDFAVLFVPMVVGMISGAWLSGWLAHHWPAQRTVKLALTLMVLGALLNVAQGLWLSSMPLTTVAPLVFYTCGIGIAMPAMTVLSLDCFPQNRGSASALQGFVQMVGNALIASVAVPLLSQQPSYLAIGQLLLVMIALLLWQHTPAAATAGDSPKELMP